MPNRSTVSQCAERKATFSRTEFIAKEQLEEEIAGEVAASECGREDTV